MVEALQSVARRVMLKAFLTGTTTAATGKTIAVVISKNGAAFGNPSAGATNATELANGWYFVDLSTTDYGTLGDLVVRGTEGTIDPVERLFAVVAATNRGMTGIPNAAANAAGGLPISAAGGLDLDAKLANTNEVTAARMGALTDWIDGGRLDLILDARAAEASLPANFSTLTIASNAVLSKLGDLAHGGTAATLRLGGSTTTPAFYVTNSGGDAVKFESTGNNAHGLFVLGNGSGDGAHIEGGTSGDGMHIIGGATNGRGIHVVGPVSEAIYAEGNVLVSAIFAVGTFNVNGTTTLTGNVSLGGTLAVTGATSLAALSMTTLTASGAVALQSTVTVTGATTLTGAVTATNASNSITGVAITSNVKKNQALANFTFLMTDSTNHEPATGLTVTCTRSIDGAAFAAGTLANVAEVANGIYSVDFGAGDLNGNTIILKATATGADTAFERIVTQP